VSFSQLSKQRVVGAFVLTAASFWSALGQSQSISQPSNVTGPAVAQGNGWARIIARGSGSVSADLFVDGKAVCHLPCQTLVPAGVHKLSGRGSLGSSADQTLYLAAGSTSPLQFDVLPPGGTIRIATESTETQIVVDGAFVSKGTWQGTVAPGRHKLQLRKPNGEVLQQFLNVAAGMTYSIRDNPTAKQTESIPKPTASTSSGLPGKVISQPNPYAVNNQGTTQPATPTGTGSQPPGGLDPTYHGITGAVFAPIMLGGPSTNGFNSTCPATEFGGSCSTGGPRGGAIGVRLGSAYGWIAPEAMVAISLDLSSAGLNLPSDYQIPDDYNGLLAQVAAGTKFMRLGLMAGGGARIATQSQGYRYTFSGTLGLVKRHVYVIPDSFFGSKPSYTAPTMFFDGGVMIGDTPGIKIYAGLFLWVEFVPDTTISRDVTTLGLDPNLVPVSLRTITPFSGTQFMFGPLVGVTFGH